MKLDIIPSYHTFPTLKIFLSVFNVSNFFVNGQNRECTILLQNLYDL